MSTRQLSISRSKEMQKVIDEARHTFPDAATDSQALTRALFHWYHDRDANSKRGAMRRIEERMTIMEQQLAALTAAVARLEARQT